MKISHLLALLLLLATPACAQQVAAPPAVAPNAPIKAPFRYVQGKAHHILPETHTDESGYFSIVEGQNGRIYVGTAKYDYNAFLVEFDPQTEQQKIVIDTNKVNGLTATGYASQSKIHTRNFVGASGKIYVGSQEGYHRIPNDVSVYPGGYVMTYDPKTEKAETLGMPMAGEGVIDVVADEARGLLYVTTTLGDDKKTYWLLGDIKTKTYRALGVSPTNYASTLMDNQGRAHVITGDSRLATYDPKTRSVSIRDIELAGKKWVRNSDSAVPTWQLTPDKKSAYLVLMTDPTLYSIDWNRKGAVRARVLGRLIEGKNYDSRSSLSIAPDGRVYALYKVDNETKFGGGYLHHLTRYDPRKKKTEDLGVLAVQNPDFFNFSPRADGTPPPWSNGYHTLPDGTMTPMYMHQGLIAARNGDLYALILGPYTLLHIPARNVGVKSIGGAMTKPVSAASGARSIAPFAHQYNAWALSAADRVEANLPEIQRVAEIVAQRHFEGGQIVFPWNGQSLQQELSGRSGGLMNIGDNRWSKERTPAQNAKNVAIIGWDRAPGGGDLGQLQKLREAGTYIIGFGPRTLPALAEHVKLCDAFFDTGLGEDDRIVTLAGGSKAGRGNILVNMLNGWALTGEIVASLTRRGVMPVMWKSWMTPDGHEWSDKYQGKTQWHDDYKIAPIAAGQLSRAFLAEMRANIRRFESGQSAKVVRAAQLIVAESTAGRKTVVAAQGHAPYTYVGQYEDARWAVLHDIDSISAAQNEAYRKNAPADALVLRLGYSGLNPKDAELFAEKKQRVMLITTPTPRVEFQPRTDYLLNIDMGWQYGDATIAIPNYPIKILPPSGIMQIIAYEGVNLEVLSRLPLRKRLESPA